MSILAVVGVIISSASMLIVLSGFGGLKSYSLEFISSISPELKISATKGVSTLGNSVRRLDEQDAEDGDISHIRLWILLRHS